MAKSARSVKECSSAAESVLKTLLGRKPASLIAAWKEKFSSLTQIADSKKRELETTLNIEIRKEPLLDGAWQIFDKLNGRRYYFGKQTTSKTVNRMLSFFTSSLEDLKAVVSLSLPDEGPLGERGAEAFDDFSFWPLTKNENRSYTGPANVKYKSTVDKVSESMFAQLRMGIESMNPIDDESVISKVHFSINFFHGQLMPDNNIGFTVNAPPAADGPNVSGLVSGLDTSDALCHIQHLNWPPDGYPPTCTFSILRTIDFIQQDNLCGKKAPFKVLVTCSDGIERSAAFGVLCCCISRLDRRSPLPAATIDIVSDMIAAVRQPKSRSAIRYLGTFIWLHYAVVEFCYASTMQGRKEEKEKEARAWLMKLRKAVYDATVIKDDVK